MILKEAFRAQNHLTSLLTSAEMYLSHHGNITVTKEIHNRKKANPNAEDEVIENKVEGQYQANDVMDFAISVLNEKDKLSKAIAKAKADAEIDIDSSISLNKARQAFAGQLSDMCDIKPSERKEQGRDYLIDNEGKQSPYVYPVEKVTSIAFDRSKAQGILKKLNKESDAISNKIDILNATIEVDYESVYDNSDNFDDAMEKYLSNK